ncbi:HlyD family secretion protein [Sphingomonas sp. ERG5]|uniref:HlyD family secretion protein n=1 Tax=Sphingomonas sp. ERG5 TaxID=1381597 RepID=UPI00054BC80F|nr:HlyD family secretion protein [Sphingomonas sp. ERG5]
MNAITMPLDVPIKARRKLPRALVVGAGAVLLAGAGATWIAMPGASESTDNAYLRADTTIVSARVGGTVTEMLVRDNQQVRAGDPLIRIDPQEYDAKLSVAEASVGDADAGVASAKAALVTFVADRQVAEADVDVAQSTIVSADAERRRAEADTARYQALSEQGFVTRRDAERIAAAAIDARAQLRRSVASLAVSRDRATATSVRRAALEADLAKAEAVAARARASLRLAQQDRGYAFVRAAVSGTIGNRQAQTGDLVQPGTRLLSIVPQAGLYVVANFKETQTGRMLIGQRARVKVDALGGKPLTGRIDSFAPASGSEFALLPFEPGSGNFTKIVQRVPVRIALDPGQPMLARLRPGLSVTATVRVKP